MMDDLERVYQAKTLDQAPDGTFRGVWLVLGEMVNVACGDSSDGKTWWRFWREKNDQGTRDRSSVGTSPNP